MKNYVLAVLLIAGAFSVSAQIPREAYDLTNSMEDLWRTSPKEKAVDASLKLNKLYQPFYLDNLHNSLAQLLVLERSKGYP